MWTPGQQAVIAHQHKVYSFTHNKNNLRVILCPVDGASVTAYMRAVNAGSKDEAAVVPKGAAHFIEHMSFRIQNGKIWSLASKGDVINAETNMDSTRFYVVHLPDQTEETIKIDAARFKSPAVPADKVSTEMQAVLNELERGQRAGSKMFRTTSAVSILEHPYHHSTIGTKTCVKSTTAKDMEHFREKFYVPNNTSLIFVGSFDPQKIMSLVDTHFGSLEPSKDCKVLHTPEPPQSGMRLVELKIPAPCPMSCMAFKAPAGSTKESLALKMISRLVYHKTEGRASIHIDDGTFHDVSTYSPRQLDPYLWFFHSTYQKTSADIRAQNQKKMLNILQTFITHKVPQEKLDHIRNSILDSWNRSTESVQDIMSEIGRSVSIGNWKDFEDKETTLKAITQKDIQDTAQKVFDQSKMTVTHVIPTKVAPKLTSSEPLVEKTAKMSPAVENLQGSQPKNQWKIQKLSPTTHLIHTPRASFVRAFVSARFSPAQHDTASLLVASMQKTPKLAQKQQLAKLHAERSFTHDHEFIHMSMEMPNSVNAITNGAKIMFEQHWLQPIFNTKNIELQKKHIISELKSRPKDQNYLVKKHFIQALFEKTQYNIPMADRIERIKNLTKNDLKQFHAKFLGQNDDTYVTMITPDVKLASALGSILPAHQNIPNQTLSWTSKERKPSSIQHKLEGYGSTAIMLGQTIPNTISYEDKIALKLAASVLGGGMTGRLMHTVREQRGLGTYGIYCVVQTVSSKTDPILCVQGTFSPTSLHEGLDVTKQLINEWWEAGITPKELADTKDKMIGSITISADEVDQLGSIMLGYILKGKNPEKALATFKATVRNLTNEKVNSVLKKYVDPTKFAEVVVGPV